VNAFVATLLVATSVAVNPAMGRAIADPLSGEWKVHNDISGNVSDMTCTFAQKGEDLTGGCATEQGNVEITGKVAETSVSWVFKSAYNGAPITLTYKGSLKDGQVAGAVTVEEFNVTGDFTATPVKADTPAK
jgi:hypothetical protein